MCVGLSGLLVGWLGVGAGDGYDDAEEETLREAGDEGEAEREGDGEVGAEVDGDEATGSPVEGDNAGDEEE